jgi:hypothetical protein
VLPDLEARNRETTLDPASSAIAHELQIPLPAVFVPPARPGESRCSGGSRPSGFRALLPLPVTVFAVTCAVKVVGCAVTGAVTAVTRGRDPAPAVTGSVPAVIAVAGGPLGQRPGLPLATPDSLAHETSACASDAATAPGGTSRHACLSRPLLPRLRQHRHPTSLCTQCQSLHVASRSSVAAVTTVTIPFMSV